MPYVYQDVDSLKKTDGPPLSAVGDGSCVALIKYYVPGLKGVPTSAWRAGDNVLELGVKVAKGTAIRIPPPRKQRNPDGSFMRPSDNALAFYVIER